MKAKLNKVQKEAMSHYVDCVVLESKNGYNYELCEGERARYKANTVRAHKDCVACGFEPSEDMIDMKKSKFYKC